MKPSDEFLMKILALEFSSPQRSVAVVQQNDFQESLSGANEPFAMIDEVLRAAKLEREQIECIAIGLGPGSYTGIRSAISIAQGWLLARGIKLLGVSSAEAIAAQAQADGATGCVQVIVDAQRGEFYIAGYELTTDGVREVEPLRIVSGAEITQRAERGEVLIGPEVTKWFPSSKIIFPRAATLGRMALARTDFIAGDKIQPIYLRETTFVKAPPPRIIS
jgi:tRNA threonylcarbamoyl adenosine modification protein YeaZ